jgi:CubicO group peptidase (beta-lactamase class C family)
MKTRLTLIAAIGLGLALRTPGQDAFPAKLDALMGAYAETDFFSGIVVVAKGGETQYERTFGLADRTRNDPIRTTTRFNIASMGKTFTSVLVMQLVEGGKLDLQAPVRTYLQGTHLPNADRITLQHLLTHTSGLLNYMIHPDFESRRGRLRTLDDAMDLVVDMPLAFETPGTRFEYSNSGYIVLGRIIEQVTGKAYLDYAREMLWGPLGMNQTSIVYPPTVRPPADAVPYYIFSPKSFIEATADEYPGFSDGGTFSTAPDLLSFARAMVAGRLLAPETRSLMLAPRATMDPDTKYGYGWQVYENLPGGRYVGHSGGGHGYSSDLKISPDDGTIILVLANVRTSPRRITQNIIRLLVTGTYDRPRPTVATYLFARMEERGLDAVLGGLEKTLAAGGFDKLEGPSTLIDVADAFATLKRYDDALRVHARNANLFPSSPRPHNAAAEVYLSLGKREEALRSFEKALAIDPRDPYAAMKIKALKETSR